MKIRSFLAAALLALAACSQVGLQTPQTFNARLAAGYTTVQTVADGARAALVAGKITKADADNVVTTERTALAALDVANQIHATDPKAGEDKLTATLTILQALNAYIATQGAKP